MILPGWGWRWIPLPAGHNRRWHSTHRWPFQRGRWASQKRPDLVCSTAPHCDGNKKLLVITHDDVIKWKHFPRYRPFVLGIHRSPVNSPHKGQWRGTLMFSVICVWINGWVNNGDLRHYLAHYDVIVMMQEDEIRQWNLSLTAGLESGYIDVIQNLKEWLTCRWFTVSECNTIVLRNEYTGGIIGDFNIFFRLTVMKT